MVSIVALSLDRFEVYRAANGESAALGVLAEVARAVRRLKATVGLVAASYRNGTIVVVAPEFDGDAAQQLGETLRSTVARLHLRNSEAVVSDYITASVVAITGRVKRAADRVQLLTQAVARVKDAATAGGDRVVTMTI
jgi:GGDEF domain-containing protein